LRGKSPGGMERQKGFMKKGSLIKMGRQGLAALLLLLVMVPSAAAGPTGNALRIGNRLPVTAFRGIGGETVRLPDGVRGKVVILHFWQIGCSSCRLEMPAMDQLYGKHRRKGLEVLAVNVGQKREVVQQFARELGVSYPLLLDSEGKGAALFGVTDLPRTYVIDRGGTVRYRILGGATPEMLQKIILSLL
jgi:cytochrome c biogenesis protein CcmG, thiol:disulfide interchange protein DsbE